MEEKVRYFRLPQPILNEQKINPLTRSLHLCEAGEIVIPGNNTWQVTEKTNNCILLYCTRGHGQLKTGQGSIVIEEGQYFILPSGEFLEFSPENQKSCRFLTAWFNGTNIRYLEKEFAVVRKVLPSVKNQVANREMLFDEIFNNLAKGFHDENLEYINFCFGHLLATFIYGHKTSDTEEGQPGHAVTRAVNYFEKNLHRKLTLEQIAREVGYSPTYFSTIFRKETGYAPVSYFSHMKIVKACEYLDQTNSKIKQISFQLGYTDPYYFTRDFKMKMGLSPRKYRNRISSRLISRD